MCYIIVVVVTTTTTTNNNNNNFSICYPVCLSTRRRHSHVSAIIGRSSLARFRLH